MIREDSAQQSGGWDSDEEYKNEEQYYYDANQDSCAKKVSSISLTNVLVQETLKVYTIESIEKV